MTRTALYARYSDDERSEASIEDQFRLCRERAGRERWQIVGSCEDAAIFGPRPAADSRYWPGAAGAG